MMIMDHRGSGRSGSRLVANFHERFFVDHLPAEDSDVGSAAARGKLAAHSVGRRESPVPLRTAQWLELASLLNLNGKVLKCGWQLQQQFTRPFSDEDLDAGASATEALRRAHNSVDRH